MRRVRTLAVVGAIVAAVAAVRARMLGQDQVRFDAEHGARDPSRST